MSLKKVYLASDHAGFELKEFLKTEALSLQIEWIDLGPFSKDAVDYPDYADKTASMMKSNPETFAVLLCGSGIGIAIAANRYSHLRAVLAESPKVASLGRSHNHCNVLVMGANIVSKETAIECIQAFFNTAPDQAERHLRRIQKLGQKGL